jgi:hypothetical protein
LWSIADEFFFMARIVAPSAASGIIPDKEKLVGALSPLRGARTHSLCQFAESIM